MSNATSNLKPGSKVKVTLVRSLAGQTKSHQETARGLGMRRIRQSSVVTATPQVLGMLNSAQHLLKIENV